MATLLEDQEVGRPGYPEKSYQNVETIWPPWLFLILLIIISAVLTWYFLLKPKTAPVIPFQEETQETWNGDTPPALYDAKG